VELLGIYKEFVHFFGFVNNAIQLLACLDLFIDIFLLHEIIFFLFFLSFRADSVKGLWSSGF